MSGDGTHPNEKYLNYNNGPLLPFPTVEPAWITLRIVCSSKYDNEQVLTFGKWHIEGAFLITFSDVGERTAHKIPSNALAIYEKRNGNAPR